MKIKSKSFNLNQIVEYITDSYKVIGNQDVMIDNAKAVHDGDQNSIVFIGEENKKKKELLIKTKASIVVCDFLIDLSNIDLSDKCLILTDNPRLTFSNIVNGLFVEVLVPTIDRSAIISDKAIMGKNCSIGHNTYVGEVTMGNNCRIHGNCYLYDNTFIGDNVTIQANSVIGSEGFGFLKINDGTFTNFPQIGGVIINDNVEIGSNSAIDRGTLGNTIIGKGTKINNLVHIAHNVTIGKNCLITAGVIISGSVTVGDNVWLSPSVVILNGVQIGDNSFVGSNSLVIRSIAKNVRVFGNPATKL